MILQEQKIQSRSIQSIDINVNVHTILFIVCGILFGLISFLNPVNQFEYYSLKSLQEALFFLLGVIYMLFQAKASSTYKSVNNKTFPVYFTTVYCVVLGLLYFLFRKELWLMAISSSAAFILPFCLNAAWKYFLAIPGKEYKIWMPHKIASNMASLFLDSIFIKIKIAKKQDDVRDSIYSVHAPHYMKLGVFFSRFIFNQKHNPDTAIEETNNNAERYAWEFFITDFYGLQKRRLDPGLSLAENKIKQAGIVYIRRIKQPVKLLTYTTKNLLNESSK